MEPHKRAKYSKSLDPDETEEVLMDEESYEELEDRDKVVESSVINPHPQKMKMTPQKPKLCFGLQELGIRQIS